MLSGEKKINLGLSWKHTKDFPNKGFVSLKEARKWVYGFVNLYNTEFLHSGIKFVTPYQRHNGFDVKLLEKRNEVYKRTKALKPERWSKNTRDWSLINQVALNPIKESEKVQVKKIYNYFDNYRLKTISRYNKKLAYKRA